MKGPRESVSDSDNDYASREQALFQRVADAAQALTDRGVPPTNTRVRAALRGGSPNDIAPALKAWKESRAAATRDALHTPALPPPIADLAQELWLRATVAAAVELKGGPTAQSLARQSEEADALRQQIQSLRAQLERESILYGELRAQAARHEAIASDALARLEASEARERKQLRDLGSARQRIVELEAAVTHLRERPSARKSAQPFPVTTAPRSKSPHPRKRAARPRPSKAQRRTQPKRAAPQRARKPRAPARRSPPRPRPRR